VHSDEWFVGKHDRSLVHSPNVSAEAETGEIVEEFVLEDAEGGEVYDIFFGEAQSLEGLEQGFQPRENGVPALKGLPPIEHVEDHIGIGLVEVVALHHGEFVEIGEQRGRFHRSAVLAAWPTLLG